MPHFSDIKKGFGHPSIPTQFAKVHYK